MPRERPSPPIELRRARIDDVPALKRLIAESARGLCREDYTDAQIEASIGVAWGVDTELVRDGTYFVAEIDGTRVGCGGWSFRRCEAEARARGFTAAELMATLPGTRLYAAAGYVAEGRVEYSLPGGVTIEFVPMRKALS
jgi:hypothetical protein